MATHGLYGIGTAPDSDSSTSLDESRGTGMHPFYLLTTSVYNMFRAFTRPGECASTLPRILAGCPRNAAGCRAKRAFRPLIHLGSESTHAPAVRPCHKVCPLAQHGATRGARSHRGLRASDGGACRLADAGGPAEDEMGARAVGAASRDGPAEVVRLRRRRRAARWRSALRVGSLH